MIELDSRGVAELISSAFNAPIVAAPTFLALLISMDSKNFSLLFVITLAFGTAVPLVMLYSFSKADIIPDLYASARKTRVIPFLGAMLSYFLGTIALKLTGAPIVITAVMLCYLGNSLIMMLITLRWKISIHASGITGPATALIYSVGLIAIPILIFVIPVGWSRIKLGAHSLAQVAAGALITIITTWLQLNIYLRFL